MEYIEISDNIVVMYSNKEYNLLNSAPQTVPSTCICFPNNLIFVDCGAYPDIALKFRQDMEARFKKSTSHLLLTHTHWDHTLAMEVFEDIDIVASERGIQDLGSFIKVLKSKEQDKWPTILNTEEEKIIQILKDVKLFLPNISVREEFKIREDVIYRIIGGHSADSAEVYFPKEKVICAGDNLVECYAQLPGNPDETIEILKHWESLDLDYIVPGHGKVVKQDFLVKLKTYFENLIYSLEELIKQNITRRDILTHPTLPYYFGKDHPNWIEGCFPNSNWIEMTIRSWHRYLKKQ
ncbi:MAG: MBL fold metallo-hydrolase [Promethearchaeota archaeon]|jgi:glyoxylase-like metal-dependent hydrolase (beta-lactamase superfamily II)